MRDIFDTNMTLYERLCESLQELDTDLSVPIIQHNNNINLSTSSFTAILDLSDEQKFHLENIINTVDKTNVEKYISCVNLLSS